MPDKTKLQKVSIFRQAGETINEITIEPDTKTVKIVTESGESELILTDECLATIWSEEVVGERADV